MSAFDEEDEEGWNENDPQVQGYQALLDPDEENAMHDHEEEEHEEEEEEVKSLVEGEEEEEEEEASVDDGQPKPFTCSLCSAFFSKFEGYREHFISSEHRYKRRDEKKRLGEGCLIETSPAEIFVNLLLYNKIPFEGVQIDVQPVDFSFSGILEYNSSKYEHQHAPSLNDLYQNLLRRFNEDHEKYQLKMPPPSFFVARDICRKELDTVWTVSRYCDDTGKTEEQIIKEVLDYCVFANIEPERERSIGHSIQTWRMFHRQESKPGFWCDICKQCFRKRKAIISHFETSDKHANNLKHLPPYRRAVQHSLFTGRLLNEFVDLEKLNYYRTRVNAYRLPPSNKNFKNPFYCTFCKKSFESTHALEKHLGWKGHREILRKRRQQDLENLPRLVTYLNFNQLTHDQRHGGIQQMSKSPEEYRLRYNLAPTTIESLHEDIQRFDSQLAQQVMQNVHNQQGHNQRFQRGRGRGRASFRARGHFQQTNRPPFHSGQYYQPRPYYPNPPPPPPPPNQFYQQNQFHLPTTFRPRYPNNKRPYPQNNYYNPRQSWANKRPRYEPPHSYQQQLQQQQQQSSSNRVDYRYVANQNNYQQQFH